MVNTADSAKEYGAAAKQALGIAKFHYKKGEFKQAAKMFHQAYKFQPRVAFLFNAARCEQRAMKLDKAKLIWMSRRQRLTQTVRSSV